MKKRSFILFGIVLIFCSPLLNACSNNLQTPSTTEPTAQLNLQSAEESMQGDTFALYIGNSFTAGLGSSTDNTGLYELTKAMFQDSRCFISMGAGLLDYSSHASGINYVELLQDAIEDESLDKSKVTHIFIVGARGDCWARNELENDAVWMDGMRNALDEIDSLIIENFPNVRYCGYVWADAVADYAHSSGQLRTYTTYTMNELLPNMLSDTCISYMGWIGWDILFEQGCFSQDGYHPNDTGYQILAKNFEAAFYGEYECQPKTLQTASFFSPAEDSPDNQDDTIQLISTPNAVYVHFPSSCSSASLSSPASQQALQGEIPIATATNIPVKVESFEEGQSGKGVLHVGNMTLMLPASIRDETTQYNLKCFITCDDQGISLYCAIPSAEMQEVAQYDTSSVCTIAGNDMTCDYTWPN